MFRFQLILLFNPEFFLIAAGIPTTWEHWSCRCALQAGSFGKNPLIMTYQYKPIWQSSGFPGTQNPCCEYF